ncbi:MAG: hypothetical protein JKY98_06570, partial [Gammaproteobacteria bacterium]|nr:hypothetical protein [Gammaproteobacteria bacterium]
MASPHKILVITFKAILVLALSSPIAVVLLALQSGPLVPLSEPLNASEISQIEQLLVNSAPPNLSNPGLQEFSLSHDELNLLVRYAGELIGTDTEINSRILLHESTLQTEFSIPVVREFIPLYLNLGAEFASRDNELELVALTTGYLRVPGALVSNLAAWIEKQFLSGTQSYDDVTELLDSVKRISISASQLQVAFQWEPALLSQVRSQAQQFFVSRHDQQRMVRHYNVLAEVVNSLPESTRAIPLTSLFRPLFEAAQLQTSLDRNPIAENRTLLLTLAAYINQDDMAQWLSPELSEQLPAARVIEVRVQRRQDLAQHIASSAALAASAGANLARIISSTKEV